MPTLRSYQQQAVNSLRSEYRAGKRAPLLVMPTGAGKTVVFSHIAHHAAARANQTLILVHRSEILKQCARALRAEGTVFGTIESGAAQSVERVQLASVFTAVRRTGRMPRPNLIVIDEAHHAAAGSWSKIIEAYPEARLLGVTATPERLDGRGLGVQNGGFFDTMVEPIQPSELVRLGYLASPRVFAPERALDLSGVRRTAGDWNAGDLEQATSRREIVGDIVEQYRRHATGMPAIAFAVSIKHANVIAESLKASGYQAAVIEGAQDDATRTQLVDDLGNNRLNVLVSCDLISEGFDLPHARVAILARPTQSRSLALQQYGRAMRPKSDGRNECIILDHAGNVMVHGFPGQDVAWDLNAGKRARAQSDDDGPRAKQCPHCYAMNPTYASVCSECGAPFIVHRPREVEQREGNLVEVSPEVLAERRARRMQEGMARTRADFEAIARERGYNMRWVDHRLAARARARA